MRDEGQDRPTDSQIDTQVGALAPLSTLYTQHPFPLPEFSINQDRGVLESERRLVSLLSAIPEGRLTRGSRKEVIQPQVPLRLPCYDFAPVTELAFGGSLPQAGWVTDFGRSRLPWRDGR